LKYTEDIEPTIPAHNRKEALDFGLALASQAILHEIEHDPETDAWLIRVKPEEYSRAAKQLRLYVEENSRPRRIPAQLEVGAIFHRGGIAWILALICLHGFVSGPGLALKEIGWMDSKAYANGEWWRLFTAVTLHSDWPHMISNATTGLVLFGLAMARYGAGLGLLASFICGVLGNVFGVWLYAQPYHALGASGMVLGALGLLALEAVQHWLRGPKPLIRILAALSGACILFLFFGANPEADMAAHLGGFVSGVVLGGLLAWGPSKERTSEVLNTICLIVFMVAVYAPWWLAMDLAISR